MENLKQTKGVNKALNKPLKLLCYVTCIIPLLLFLFSCAKSDQMSEKNQEIFNQILTEEEAIATSFKTGEASDTIGENELQAFGLSVVSFVGLGDVPSKETYDLVVRTSKYLKKYLDKNDDVENPDFLSLYPTLLSLQAWYLNDHDAREKASGLVQQAISSFNEMARKYPNSILLKINRAMSFSKFPVLFNTRIKALSDFYWVVETVEANNINLPKALRLSIYQEGAKLVEDLAGDKKFDFNNQEITVLSLEDYFTMRLAEIKSSTK